MKIKIGKVILSGILALTSFFQFASPVNGQEHTVEYQIYPAVHQIQYGTESFVITDSVHVIYDAEIDSYTRQKLENTLQTKGIQIEEGSTPSDTRTNIYVGIYGSTSAANTYLENQVSYDPALFQNHINPYVLDIQKSNIAIVGDSSDSVYYGVVSFMHILNQLDGRTIRQLTIEDYADTKTRGFIEGYYGIPWSNADRMSLMRFGGDFKMTSYIFAPKDDPYHKNLWRELYPDAQLNEIKEMVQVGLESKCRFVWTAHPFMGGFNSQDVDGEIAALLRKFDQLYEAGVRQFGVLGDDVGSLDRAIVIKMMNAVSEWGIQKGDVYDPVFCPAGYNHSWAGNYSELNDYDAGFPKNVQIFWTGEAVCKPVEQITLDHFRTQNARNGKRRAPLFWLNWPVNDINMNRLLMGQGSMLHTDVNPQDLEGVVTNPMQDAQASKVALFAVADYTWNISGFQSKTSWEDSFEYIEPDAYDALKTLSKHMSDPSPNGHGLVLDESADIKDLLDSYLSKLEQGTLTSEDHAQLMKELKTIQDACAQFQSQSKNDALKKELLPFTQSLSDLMDAGIGLIQTQQAIEESNAADVWSYYSKASNALAASKKHDRPVLNGTKMALPGSKRLIPFVNAFHEKLAPVVQTMVDDSKIVTTFITNRKDTPENALETLTDQNESTQVIWKQPNTVSEGTYIGLSYSKPVLIEHIQFKMGQSSNLRDTFQSGKLQYTENGKDWVDIEGTSYDDRRALVEVQDLHINAKAIRLVSTASQENFWIGCRDIVVNPPKETQQDTSVQGTAIYHRDLMTIPNGYGSLERLTDGNTAEYTAFAKGPYTGPDKDTTQKGAWVGLEFDQKTSINHFVLEQGSSGGENDRIEKAVLEYSEDGQEWKTLNTYQNLGTHVDLSFPVVEAKKIRLVNEETKRVWWRVREIQASLEEQRPNPTVFHSERFGIYGNYTKDRMLDGKEDTFTWFSYGNDTALVGDTVGIDLGGEFYLQSIHFSMGSDAWNVYDLEVSKDGEEYSRLASLRGPISDVNVEGQNVKARYVRMVNKEQKGVWLQVKEFQVQATQTVNQHLEQLYTNVKKESLQGVHVKTTEDHVSITGLNNIKMTPDDYIGVQFDRIKDISRLHISQPDGFTLETSLNGVVWNPIAKSAEYEDARYVRLRNTSGSDQTLSVESFEVESLEYQPISVKETNFGAASTHLNAFDQDRTTEAVFQRSQLAGSFIVYDLGQTVTLDSLKLVLHDGTTDFPRHAKVQISNDAASWKDVVIMGDPNQANAGEAENTDTISDIFPVHEISYNTLETTEIHQPVRYIRFEITRNKAGADKWVRIREIELNGGNLYLPSINDPTIVVDASQNIEGSSNTRTRMIDGNVSTTFQPQTTEAGSFTYRLSALENVKKVSILQSPATISNARVEAEVVQNGDVSTVGLGNLISSLNEFDVSSFDHLLSIRVAWEDNRIPKIHEIITSGIQPQRLDKKALQAQLDQARQLDFSLYASASVQDIEEAITLGQTVLTSPYSTQAMLDSAEARIKGVIRQAIIKPDLQAYERKLEETIRDVGPEDMYLPRTWRLYAGRLEQARQAKENENVSQEQLDAYIESLKESIQQLKYEVTSAESLQLFFEHVKAYNEDEYTPYSVKVLQEALEQSEALLKEDKNIRVLPSRMQSQKESLKKLVDEQLLSNEELNQVKALITQAEAFNENDYTPASYRPLQSALDTTRQALDDPELLKPKLIEAKQNLEEAMNNLHPVSEMNGILALMESLKGLDPLQYTTQSYQNMKDEMDRVTRALETSHDYDAYIQDLLSAKESLVDVSALRSVLEEAKSMECDHFTPDSKQALNEKISQGEALLADGQTEDIHQTLEAIRQQMDGMIYTDEYVQQQVEPYRQYLNQPYTAASKQALKDVLDSLDNQSCTASSLQGIIDQLQHLADDLVDVTSLNEVLKEADKIQKDDYTSVSYEKFQEAWIAAQALLEKGSEVQIQDAIQSLTNAMEQLEKQSQAEPEEPEIPGTPTDSKDPETSTEDPDSSSAASDASEALTSSTAVSGQETKGDSLQTEQSKEAMITSFLVQENILTPEQGKVRNEQMEKQIQQEEKDHQISSKKEKDSKEKSSRKSNSRPSKAESSHNDMLTWVAMGGIGVLLLLIGGVMVSKKLRYRNK